MIPFLLIFFRWIETTNQMKFMEKSGHLDLTSTRVVFVFFSGWLVLVVAGRVTHQDLDQILPHLVDEGVLPATPEFCGVFEEFFCSGFCCGPFKKGLDRQGGYVNLT